MIVRHHAVHSRVPISHKDEMRGSEVHNADPTIRVGYRLGNPSDHFGLKRLAKEKYQPP